ncbi:MAG: ABC transporter ATP-binding protein [Bacillota bacterium]
MAGVRLVNVSKHFGGVAAVRDFALDIADHEFLVLVGPSGCGKSTTLRLVAGLEESEAGDIYIGDVRVNDLPPKDRDIAMVFQNYALYPHMNVYENMSFGLKLRHVPKAEIERRVKEAAAALDITDLLKRRPGQLSGGQRQRVALGRAIVREPKVFLMDEPLSNLDAKLRVQMRGELIRLHARLQTTVIYVTHDQIEAMTMGTRIVVMKDGVIQQVATPRDLYQSPANLFVAGFIGSPPMNSFPAILSAEGERARLSGDGLVVDLPPRLFGDLSPQMGQKVFAGIRPEHVRLETAYVDAHPEGRLRATVVMTEPMGAEVFVHLKAGSHVLTARAPGDFRAEIGQALPAAIEVERIHLFDGTTEQAVARAR